MAMMEIKFTPQRLMSLVQELDRRIKVATGQPLRLDFEIYLTALRRYKETKEELDIPPLHTLERLAMLISRLKEEELLDSFFCCLEKHTSSHITNLVIDYYFDNYTDRMAKDYLNQVIHIQELKKPGWSEWARNRDVFFQGDVVRNVALYVISEQILLSQVPERLGMPTPNRLREDAFSLLCNNDEFLGRYLAKLHLNSLIELLKDEQLQRLHAKIWNNALPLHVVEAKRQKIDYDHDHPLFALAKVKLQPTKSPQWLSLSDSARNAYQEWALGTRLESFFDKDSSNERVIFWKRHIRYIEELKEIECRGHMGAISILIGEYEFVEFLDIGAIYVYKRGKVKIPSWVRNLDALKFRTKVVNAGMGVEHGEGWIAHLGKVWPQRVNKLINVALL